MESCAGENASSPPYNCSILGSSVNRTLDTASLRFLTES